MPPPMHYKVTLSGIFGTPTVHHEIWAMNLSLQVLIPDSTGPNTTAMKTLADQTATNWATNLMPRVSSAVRLTRTRVAQVGSNGRVVLQADGSYKQADSTSAAQPATVAAPAFPYQVALALGLRTQRAGQVGRGRVYLPLPVGSMGIDGTFSETDQTSHLNAFKAFCDTLNTNAAAGGFGRLSVASGGSVLKAIQPALYPVTRVEVGKVPDIQRRRGADLPELYKEVALA